MAMTERNVVTENGTAIETISDPKTISEKEVATEQKELKLVPNKI